MGGGGDVQCNDHEKKLHLQNCPCNFFKTKEATFDSKSLLTSKLMERKLRWLTNCRVREYWATNARNLGAVSRLDLQNAVFRSALEYEYIQQKQLLVVKTLLILLTPFSGSTRCMKKLSS
jgi:hypothetical protein